MSDSEDEVVQRRTVKRNAVLSDDSVSEAGDIPDKSHLLSVDDSDEDSDSNNKNESSTHKKRIVTMQSDDDSDLDSNIDRSPVKEATLGQEAESSDSSRDSAASSVKEAIISQSVKPSAAQMDSKHRLDPDIFDADGDSDDNNKSSRSNQEESDDEKSDVDASDEDDKPMKKVGRWLNSKGASMSAKPKSQSRQSKPKAENKSKESTFKIHSETQRIIRESEVSLPYHQPVQFSSFREFKLAIQSGDPPTEEIDMIPPRFRDNVESSKEERDVTKEPGDKLPVECEDLVESDLLESENKELPSSEIQIGQSEMETFPHLPETPVSPDKLDSASLWKLPAHNQKRSDETAAQDNCNIDENSRVDSTSMAPPLSTATIKSKKLILLSKFIVDLPEPKLSGCDEDFIDLDVEAISSEEKKLQNFVDRFHSHGAKPKKVAEKPPMEEKPLTIVKKVCDEQGEHLELENVPYKSESSGQQESTRSCWRNHRQQLKGLMREKRLQNYEERCKKYGPEIEKRREREKQQQECEFSDDDEEWNVEMDEDDTDTASLSSSSDEEATSLIKTKKSKKLKSSKRTNISFFDDQADEDADNSDTADEEEQTEKDEKDCEKNESDDEYANEELLNQRSVDETVESNYSQPEERKRIVKERRQLCLRMAREGLDQGDLDLFASEYSLFMNKTGGTLEETVHSKLGESASNRCSRVLSPYMSRGSPHPPRLRERHRWEMSPRIPRCTTVDGVISTPDKLRNLLEKLEGKYGLARHTERGESSILLLPSGKTTDQIIKRYFKEQIRDFGEMKEEDFIRYQKLLLSNESMIDPESEWNYLGLQFTQAVTFDYDDHCYSGPVFSSARQGQDELPDNSEWRELFLEQQGLTQISNLKSQNSFNTNSSRRSSISSINKSQSCEKSQKSSDPHSQDTVILGESQRNSITKTNGMDEDFDDDATFRPVFQDPAEVAEDSQNLPFDPNSLISQLDSDNSKRKLLFGNSSMSTQSDAARRVLFGSESQDSQLKKDEERKLLFDSDPSQSVNLDKNDNVSEMFQFDPSQLGLDCARRKLFCGANSQSQIVDEFSKRSLFASDPSQTQLDKENERRRLFQFDASQSQQNEEVVPFIATSLSQSQLDKERKLLFASDPSQSKPGSSSDNQHSPINLIPNSNSKVETQSSDPNMYPIETPNSDNFDCENIPWKPLTSDNESEKEEEVDELEGEEEEEIGFRKRVPRVIDDSDEESSHSHTSTPEDAPKADIDHSESDDNQSNVPREYSDGENLDDVVDDDEEELLRQKVSVKKKINKIDNFVELEAELSGSDVGSGDENEDEDDAELDEEMRAFIDLNNAEEEENGLREQVERVHNRLQIDQDVREVKYLQELYLEGGDLHSENKRQRRFKWLGVDDVDSDLPPDLQSDEENADETALDDSLVEDHRPKYSLGQGPVVNPDLQSDDEQSDDEEMETEESQFLNLGKKALQLMKRPSIDSNLSEMMKAPRLPGSNKPIASSLFISENSIQKSITECKPPAHQELITNNKDPELSKKPVVPCLLTKRGSFLNRSSNDMNRLNTMVKTSDTTSLRNKAGLVCFSIGALPGEDEATPNLPSSENNSSSAFSKLGKKRLSMDNLQNQSKKRRSEERFEKRPLKQSNSIFSRLN